MERQEALEAQIGHHFSNASLLEQALTHASACQDGLPSNERMEFLGDALLTAEVCCYFYNQCPDAPEGILSKYKSDQVSTSAFAERARSLRLDRIVRVGRSLDRRKLSDLLMANLFEALAGAVYLDGGDTAIHRFTETMLFPKLKAALCHNPYLDAKSAIQEWSQSKGLGLPTYTISSEEGPPHDRIYTISVTIGDDCLGEAKGPSKKEAEQRVAALALEALEDANHKEI